MTPEKLPEVEMPSRFGAYWRAVKKAFLGGGSKGAVIGAGLGVAGTVAGTYVVLDKGANAAIKGTEALVDIPYIGKPLAGVAAATVGYMAYEGYNDPSKIGKVASDAASGVINGSLEAGKRIVPVSLGAGGILGALWSVVTTDYEKAYQAEVAAAKQEQQRLIAEQRMRAREAQMVQSGYTQQQQEAAKQWNTILAQNGVAPANASGQFYPASTPGMAGMNTGRGPGSGTAT